MHDENKHALHRLLDKSEIYDSICRYARGIDRGDWDLVRSTYHPDADDDHVEYKGGIDGLIEWLDKRFAGIDNSMHFPRQLPDRVRWTRSGIRGNVFHEPPPAHAERRGEGGPRRGGCALSRGVGTLCGSF